jgi:hypothetical protein
MDNLHKKIESFLNYKGKIHVRDWEDFMRLKKKYDMVGELTVIEDMALDSILEIYDITVL